jgi:hypothetical protein
MRPRRRSSAKQFSWVLPPCLVQARKKRGTTQSVRAATAFELRLALAVYINTQGTAETRERLMGFALTLSNAATIH